MKRSTAPQAPPPRYFYIGDDEPSRDLLWKTRKLLYLKPDYLVVFDELVGSAAHRLNWHVTADVLEVTGNHVRAQGRFGLDLQAWVFSPGAMRIETGEIIPGPNRFGQGSDNPHRQCWFRTYSDTPAYLSVLYAGGGAVSVSQPEPGYLEIRTADFCDHIVLGSQHREIRHQRFAFSGRSGWLREEAGGRLSCGIIEGAFIGLDGAIRDGVGPWHWGADATGATLLQGPPRPVVLRHAPAPALSSSFGEKF